MNFQHFIKDRTAVSYRDNFSALQNLNFLAPDITFVVNLVKFLYALFILDFMARIKNNQKILERISTKYIEDIEGLSECGICGKPTEFLLEWYSKDKYRESSGRKNLRPFFSVSCCSNFEHMVEIMEILKESKEIFKDSIQIIYCLQTNSKSEKLLEKLYDAVNYDDKEEIIREGQKIIDNILK